MSAVDRARHAVGRAVRSGLHRVGFELVRRADPAPAPLPPDLDDRTLATIEAVRRYTLTETDRIATLVAAVRHVAVHRIPGALVECGVWRGGSMLAIARTLVEQGETDRDLYLYDTFDRMPPPADRDVDVWGNPASSYFDGPVDPHDTDHYRYLPMEEVRSVVLSSGYPPARVHLVQGLVEETIPSVAPERIALLRLDTDWYSSTAHEMRHLYPRIVDQGFLLVDDYGQFLGARDAVDEHLADVVPAPFLHRIDFTGRLHQIRR